MPPKKKARLPSRAASTPAGETQEPQIAVPATPETITKVDAEMSDFVNDPWTDEQETSLFKGTIRWKPVGMHKHFRMIALSQHLRNNGYTTPEDGHTRIPGIWEKLGSLYNLDALDERENSIGDDVSDDSDPAKEPFSQFRLPQADFGDRMFNRRLAPDGSASPSWLQHQFSDRSASGTRRASTVEDTEDPRSSPASIRGQKATRNARGSRSIRRSGLQAELKPPTGRRGSKNPSVVTEENGEAEEAMEVDGDEGKDEDENDELETESHADDAVAASPAMSGAKNATKATKGGAQKRRRVNARRAARRR
ncbi:MAG: hypothetical protein M1830_002651 [Pleopsidium flavum]|nr:MAG: hypothetical protein M1830_002651 [Pleopsidium flavum]